MILKYLIFYFQCQAKYSIYAGKDYLMLTGN